MWGSRKLGEQDCISCDLEVHQRGMGLRRKQEIGSMWLLYPSQHLNFLGNSTHHGMSAEVRYTHTGILTYAVVARCYVDAAYRRKTYFPCREILTMILKHLFFKAQLRIFKSFSYFWAGPSRDCHLHPCFSLWGNNRFHMVRVWYYLIGLLCHTWQIVPFPLVTDSF